ncbi:hypothetical protein Tco_0825755, partial [Tanacetum coccineum]
MGDDFFTYEVEIYGLANIPCDLNEEDDSEQRMTHGSGDDMEGDDEVKLTDEKSSDSNNEDEVAEIFRIDTNVFDFETPMCKAFKEFNYLLQIDPDVLTEDIEGSKTHEDYKDDWIYEWNEDVPWWPTYSWKDDGYCNGGKFPGAYIVRNTLRYQDLKWYEALKDGKLKEEALNNKATMEWIIDKDDESSNEGWKIWDNFEDTNRDQEEREYEMDEEEYVAIKENEYDDL